ncbi:FtsX-like permease family protein [Actinomadura parmotrematis]|uniref:ABC transporter permease n=1 Tax=Actinomadura parmotrematis TaxID=2864039 RepID=A0ABS7FPL0_9ACTN|nr:ABC transporter permease [Actinomadura parmotrematis]MBW8482296.1 ABC transporter permease [Actinomadura parmotrematis]
MFVAWRDLRHARGRFALMGTVIVLITLLVGLLSGLTAGLGRQNTSAVTGLPADRIVFAAPGRGQDLSYAESALTAGQVRAWDGVPGVRSAEPLGVTSTRAAAAGGRSAGVAVFGVRPGSPLAPGAVGGGTAVLSAGAADALGVRAGDAVAVAGRRLTVAAVRGAASFSHTPVVWTDLATWRAAAPPSGDARPAATVLALRTSDGAGIAAADRAAGTRTVAKGASLAAIGAYSSENASLQLMRGFLFAISALVVGAFFTVWTIQRSGDVAVLKALGAPTALLLRDALGQALVLLVAGTALGTALAAGAGALVAGRVPFAVSPAGVLGPAAVLIALGAGGAALAVRRITSVDPLTALGSVR